MLILGFKFLIKSLGKADSKGKNFMIIIRNWNLKINKMKKIHFKEYTNRMLDLKVWEKKKSFTKSLKLLRK